MKPVESNQDKELEEKVRRLVKYMVNTQNEVFMKDMESMRSRLEEQRNRYFQERN